MSGREFFAERLLVVLLSLVFSSTILAGFICLANRSPHTIYNLLLLFYKHRRSAYLVAETTTLLGMEVEVVCNPCVYFAVPSTLLVQAERKPERAQSKQTAIETRCCRTSYRWRTAAPAQHLLRCRRSGFACYLVSFSSKSFIKTVP